MKATSDGLMSTAEERPGQAMEKGKGMRKQESMQETPHLSETQGDEDGQISPRWRLKAESVWVRLFAYRGVAYEGHT